jgi:hypothetical protein
MLRPPPHPADQADRTQQLLAAVRVVPVAVLTASDAAGLASQLRWQRPGLSTHPAQAREATP